MKIGLTANEIANTTTTDFVDWQREMCWQLAMLREELDRARLVSDLTGAPDYRVHLHK